MKRSWTISLLSVSALALVACGSDKPANDASSETSTTSARYPDGTVSSNVNDTSATGAATNTSPKNQPGDNTANGATSTTAAMNGTNDTAGPTGSTTGTPLWGNSPSTSNGSKPSTPKSTKTGTSTAAMDTTPAPGSQGNAAGASGGAQPGATAPPPPNGATGNGGSAVTPIDQGNGQSDLKITQAIRKEVVGNSDLSFTAKNVKIITKNGHVVLKGEVKTQAEKQAIEGTATRVAGNANVDDQVVVKP